MTLQQVNTTLVPDILSDEEKLTRLAGCGIKRMQLTFKKQYVDLRSKANLDVMILFGKNHLSLGPEIRRMLVRN